MTIALPLPSTQPAGYEWLADEPPFDPNRHLALEAPSSVLTLADLGYQPHDTTLVATEFAASEPFRVLSDEGAAVMLDVARQLRHTAKPASDRVENAVRGGVYRSRWLRDLCLSPDLTAHMAAIYGVEVAPHTMGVHLGHMNHAPSDLSKAVDKWHVDTLPLDMVMMVSDPATLDGGEFEYFVGTKHEMAQLASEGRTPPPERCVAPDFGGPGWAIALHGNMVVHRGAPLNSPGERITMVNGYVSVDPSRDDQNRTRDLMLVDDHDVLFTEWVRHVAWRTNGRMQELIDETPFGISRADAVEQLRWAIADAEQAIAEIEAGPVDAHHYEK